MKEALSTDSLPVPSVVVTCSSHEARCMGLISWLGKWRPEKAILFHYDDANPERERHHAKIEAALHSACVPFHALQFTEASAVSSLRNNLAALRSFMSSRNLKIVLDISVFTKRHLLMMLRWFDDEGLWDQLTIVYSEPEAYDASQFIPLSFGLASLQPTPGFPASPDLSRPLHLVLFLGYEGDRALASYEHIQPMRTTLIVPHPPYRDEWLGRTEQFNSDLLALVGNDVVERVNPIDPDKTTEAMERILGSGPGRREYATIVCPLGTKPQALGLYGYVRTSPDPPAIVYAGPLRHNHGFSSHGMGPTWILKQTRLP